LTDLDYPVYALWFSSVLARKKLDYLAFLSFDFEFLYFGKPEVNRADLSCIFSLS
jgi:hypothetical protein